VNKLQAIAILSSGLVAGIFVMGTFAVHPAVSELDAAAHMLVRQQLIRRLARFMPPLVLLPVAVIIAKLAFTPSGAGPLDLFAGSFALATLAITVCANAPLNRRFARWKPDALPPDWKNQIRRWNFVHSLRMITSLAAFTCAILAAGVGR